MWQEQGYKNPNYDDRPQMDEFGARALRAWRELHSSRDEALMYTTLVLPPLIEEQRIESWARMHGIVDPDAQTDLYDLVRALDIKWRSVTRKKMADLARQRQEDSHGGRHIPR